mgnify:CR=1 FL=1
MVHTPGVAPSMRIMDSQIRAYLIRGCLRRSDMAYPNNQWGYGSVQLMQSFHLMRELYTPTPGAVRSGRIRPSQAGPREDLA